MLVLYINGTPATMDGSYFSDPLADAVFRSLFSWSRARADDELPSSGERFGWWGDLLSDQGQDAIGSRLWTLIRSVDTAETRLRAREACEEALQWMIDDGMCSAVDVQVEHYGMGQIAIGVTLTRDDGSQTQLNFAGLWNGI